MNDETSGFMEGLFDFRQRILDAGKSSMDKSPFSVERMVGLSPPPMPVTFFRLRRLVFSELVSSGMY
jgi:hypothetical protein